MIILPANIYYIEIMISNIRAFYISQIALIMAKIEASQSLLEGCPTGRLSPLQRIIKK